MKRATKHPRSEFSAAIGEVALDTVALTPAQIAENHASMLESCP